jgi:hypothetical protein
MIIPSLASTIAFVAIVLLLAVLFAVSIHVSGTRRGHSSEQVAHDTRRAAIAMAIYLALTAAVAGSGLLASDGLPPPALLFLATVMVLTVGLACSGVGSRIATGVSIAALVGFQAFRLPLELVLHRWFVEGTIPIQMTYSGENFDIVTGVLAVAIGVWAAFGRVPSVVLWAFNIVGLALLLRVMSIAVLSAPLPLRRYMAGPAAQLPLHVPYVWIVPICVGGALFGHILLFRRLSMRP